MLSCWMYTELMPSAEGSIILKQNGVNIGQSLILCDSAMHLLGLFVKHQEENLNVVYQQTWGSLTTLTKAVGSILCADCAVHRDVWVFLVMAVLLPRCVEWARGGRAGLRGLLAVCWSIPYSVFPAHTRKSESEIVPLGWKVTSSPTSNKPPLYDWYLGQSSSHFLSTCQNEESWNTLSTVGVQQDWLGYWYWQTARQARH